MVEKDSSRRDLLRLAVIGAAVTALSSKEAVAYQGNMERALESLHAALDSLQQATSEKGGHRVHAMDLIRQAIFQTEAGIRFANEHGGGRRASVGATGESPVEANFVLQFGPS